MAITVVQTDSKNTGGFGANAIDHDYSNTPTEGNLLVAFLIQRFSGLPVTPPVGWDVLFVEQTNSPLFFFYYKIAGPSEPTNVAFSWGGSPRQVILILREYEGVNTDVPIQNSVYNNNGIQPDLSSGPTEIAQPGNNYSEAVFAAVNEGNWETDIQFSNGYQLDFADDQVAGSVPIAWLVSKSIVPGETTETTITTSDSGSNSSVWLAIFNTAPQPFVVSLDTIEFTAIVSYVDGSKDEYTSIISKDDVLTEFGGDLPRLRDRISRDLSVRDFLSTIGLTTETKSQLSDVRSIAWRYQTKTIEDGLSFASWSESHEDVFRYLADEDLTFWSFMIADPKASRVFANLI